MDDSDGGIAVGCFLHQKRSERLADDVTSADDHDVFAQEGDLVVVQENVDAVGCTGNKAVLFSHEQFSCIDRMETIDVFGWIDCREDFVEVDVIGEGELDEDPIDLGVSVELCNFVQKSFFRDRCGELAVEGDDPDFLAALFFHPDIGARGGVVSHEDKSKARLAPCTLRNCLSDVIFDAFCNFCSVK